ncbi:hypothetical protein [Natronolimnohabitans innermongolicus]|uniref:hypothetical protein n=1 Tax=Natronolimnohabitans innermongolicus TaxID=253107 RepID=UPI0013755B0D|nr:hypothetical protein [Natronolimnohabitans innermongolicus]
MEEQFLAEGRSPAELFLLDDRIAPATMVGAEELVWLAVDGEVAGLGDFCFGAVR